MDISNITRPREKPSSRVIFVRVYPPIGQSSNPKIELCRTIARNVDVHEERLAKVPKVGDEFFVDLARYVCLRVDDSYAVPGFAAVVFVARPAQ